MNNEHPFWQGSLECKRGALIGEQKGREDRGKSEGRSSPLISHYTSTYPVDQLHLFISHHNFTLPGVRSRRLVQHTARVYQVENYHKAYSLALTHFLCSRNLIIQTKEQSSSCCPSFSLWRLFWIVFLCLVLIGHLLGRIRSKHTNK